MTLKIISADDIIFQGEAVAVHLPGANGAFTVLKNHASLISTLVPGFISYRTSENDEHEHSVEVSKGGIVNIDKNIVSVCIF